MPLAWRCCARQSSGPRPGLATGTSGVAVQDGLVACRLQHQCPPLLRPGRGCAAARIPDAGAPAECGVPWVGCIALLPLYASRNLRRAVVVDEAFPAVRQQRRRNDV